LLVQHIFSSESKYSVLTTDAINVAVDKRYLVLDCQMEQGSSMNHNYEYKIVRKKTSQSIKLAVLNRCSLSLLNLP